MEKLTGSKNIQSLCSDVDDSSMGAAIEQLWMCTEEDGTIVPQWYQGTVVAVKSMNKDHIEWDKSGLREDDVPSSEEKLRNQSIMSMLKVSGG